MSVDLSTKVLCLKASIHFLIISNLYFILTIALTAATIYAYFFCPKEFMGAPFPEEDLKKMREEVIMKVLGGFSVIPFISLSFVSGFISCFKYKQWFGLCSLISFGLALAFLIYDGYVLFYLKLKYVWPPFILVDVQAPLPPGAPFSAEFILLHFTEVLITTLTVAMFSVVSILLYCSFLLFNLSFLYKSPKPIPHRRRRAPIRRREEDEEEDDETGGEEKEEKNKEIKKDEDEKKEEEVKDEKKAEKEKSIVKSEKGTGTQTGTGT